VVQLAPSTMAITPQQPDQPKSPIAIPADKESSAKQPSHGAGHEAEWLPKSSISNVLGNLFLLIILASLIRFRSLSISPTPVRGRRRSFVSWCNLGQQVQALPCRGRRSWRPRENGFPSWNMRWNCSKPVRPPQPKPAHPPEPEVAPAPQSAPRYLLPRDASSPGIRRGQAVQRRRCAYGARSESGRHRDEGARHPGVLPSCR